MSETATFTLGTVPSSEAVPPAPRSSGGRARGLLVLVLILVNSAAIWGQAGWALENIVPAGWDWRAGLALSLGFAAALELIGVFLATAADEAEEKGQPAGGVRIGSYAVGLISGGLNLSHWGLFTAAAFAFGFLSTVSPFLWGVWSRVRRGRPVAPSRRFWHPIESVKLIRFMAWEGIVSEIDAIRELDFRNAPEIAPVSPPGRSMTKAEIGTEAFRLKAEDPTRSWESIASEFGISASHLYQCRKASTAGGAR